MSSRARRGFVALVALLIVLGSFAIAAPPASAAGPEVISLTGHGNGHGRGMGQYGAKGYADAGQTADQILAHYYGGTTAGSRPNGALKVLLCDLEGTGITICTSAPGINQIIVSSDSAYAFAGGVASVGANVALRVTRQASPAGWKVEQAAGGCSATAFSNYGDGFTGDVMFDITPGASLLKVCSKNGREYRGSLQFAMQGDKSRVRNIVTVEDYLKGVVPSEMPSSWNMEALKVQAVAARSYALAGDSRFPNFADTCDTTQCQVYRGRSGEADRSSTAIDQTAGLVRIKDGAVARTEFSASTGGWTAGGTFPAVEDTGDDVAENTNHSWTASVQASAIEGQYPTIGDLQAVQVTKRNGLGADGGRVQEVKLVGASSTATLSGDTFRSKFGLKSDWFTPGLGFTRIQGADRYATAAAIARATYPSSSVALIARGDGAGSFADGLAANFVGGNLSAPTLLSTSTSVPAVTLDALRDLGVKTIHLLGGTTSLSTQVEESLKDAGYTVDRHGGEDRYATAAAIARVPGSIGSRNGKPAAVLSSGETFPDALTISGAVYALHYPQLLTQAGALPAATSSAIADLGIRYVMITGGTSTVSQAVADGLQALGIEVQRIAGPTRYETAVAIADVSIDQLGFDARQVDIATGETFPDALTGGAHSGRNRAPIVLSARSSAHAATCDYLKRRRSTIAAGAIFGGTASVDDAAASALQACLRS